MYPRDPGVSVRFGGKCSNVLTYGEKKSSRVESMYYAAGAHYPHAHASTRLSFVFDDNNPTAVFHDLAAKFSCLTLFVACRCRRSRRGCKIFGRPKPPGSRTRGIRRGVRWVAYRSTHSLLYLPSTFQTRWRRRAPKQCTERQRWSP